MIHIKNLAVNLSDERPLVEIVANHLSLKVEEIVNVKIVRKAIDARRYRGAEIKFIYNFDVELLNEKHEKSAAKKLFELQKPNIKMNPIVVGFGPAGMFAALTLAKLGLDPLIFERGTDVDTRQIAVDKFFSSGILDTKTNVQFGEGGAGTFSDGKLTTRLNDELIDEIIETFIDSGAPSEIRYLQKPHIGTDKLREIVKNIRNKIIALGGKIFFNAQITDIEIKDNKIQAVIVNKEQRIVSDTVFFAIGHSARDTYEMLNNHGVAMESKAFAIGVRIEHPQELINHAQYGADSDNPKLPVADYFLTFKPSDNDKSRKNFFVSHPPTHSEIFSEKEIAKSTKNIPNTQKIFSDIRGAYTFCMCPGGQVVAATSENDRVVTNGMSNFNRNSGIANAAVLANVNKNDFTDYGRDALCGMRFQQKYESLAFKLGGNNYYAPVQTVGDFLNGHSGSTQFLVKPTYPIGFKTADLHECLPKFVTATLEVALQSFDKKINGFAADDVVMTGIETRTSAPCRILRDRENFMSINIAGLYPIGEGSGYSGGIMSSALDGLKAVLSLCNKK